MWLLETSQKGYDQNVVETGKFVFITSQLRSLNFNPRKFEK